MSSARRAGELNSAQIRFFQLRVPEVGARKVGECEVAVRKVAADEGPIAIAERKINPPLRRPCAFIFVLKHIAGKGNVGKAEVMAAVRALGHEPADDNEADALAILNWALTQQAAAMELEGAL